MAPRSSRIVEIASSLTLAAGIVAIAFGLLADVAGLGGVRGIGTTQLLVVAAGVVAVGVAVTLPGRLREKARAAAAGLAARAPALSGWQCVWIAAWLGLVLGLIEVIHTLSRKLFSDVLLRVPLHYGWMVPVSYLLLFGAFGLLLALGRRLAPRLAMLPLLVFIAVAAGTWAQLRLHQSLDQGAVVLLSVGVAFQVARTAGASPRFVTLARRSLPPVAGLVLAAFVAVPVYQGWQRRAAAAALPAAPESAPNVLLIVLDTVRADHVRSYGYGRDTAPAFERLAREGALFERAFSTAPWTLPSHASMFTGHYPHEQSADWLSPLDDRHPTLAEAFRAAGYDTGGFVGNWIYTLAENGLGRGFARYEDIQPTWPVFVASSSLGRLTLDEITMRRKVGGNDAEGVRDLFLDWLDERDERPWFAFLNLADAHALYICPEPYQDRWGRWQDHVVDWYRKHHWTAAQMQTFRDCYDGCLSYVDAQVGAILDVLAARDELDDTLVVVTSDHGEQFGEHGLTDHGNSLYSQLLHVPLVLRFPGHVPAGRRIAQPVSQCDLPRTLLDLAGVPAPQYMPGVSWTALWSDGDDACAVSPVISEVSQGVNRPAYEPASRGDMRSVVDGSLHLIQNGDGKLELYDLDHDFAETHDLRPDAGSDRLQRLLQRLREPLQR